MGADIVLALFFFFFSFHRENFLKELALGEWVTWADCKALSVGAKSEGSIRHHPYILKFT